MRNGKTVVNRAREICKEFLGSADWVLEKNNRIWRNFKWFRAEKNLIVSKQWKKNVEKVGTLIWKYVEFCARNFVLYQGFIHNCGPVFLNLCWEISRSAAKFKMFYKFSKWNKNFKGRRFLEVYYSVLIQKKGWKPLL